MTESAEIKQLIELILQKKENLTAMLAPSFPIDFPYPEIVGKLKRTGFNFVVEVARGAVETNKQVIEELKKDPQKRIIASPCPSFKGYLQAQHPQLAPFLSQADSPMVATAKLVLEKFPQTRPVFIGPCLTKKLEAQEWPDLKILVITFKELACLFERLKIEDSTEDLIIHFDLLGPQTRLYPISGGLCQSAGIDEFLTKQEYRMVSGIPQFNDALSEFIQDKTIRLLDILFCDGGCIGGLGIVSQKNLDEKRQTVVDYWHRFSSQK